ncbi:MAG: hypothetical protein QXU31_01480 [Archaeoglobaceae archaeon]
MTLNSETLQKIEQLRKLATELSNEYWRSEALGHTSKALVELGMIEDAVKNCEGNSRQVYQILYFRRHIDISCKPRKNK